MFFHSAILNRLVTSEQHRLLWNHSSNTCTYIWACTAIHPWEVNGGWPLWSLCETCLGSHSTRLYNGRMPDVTFDVNVIWANLILEAFRECCCEVLALFWLWAACTGRAVVWEAVVVLNGLSRPVKLVAPLVFWDSLDVCVPSASSCCYLRIQVNWGPMLFSTFSRTMTLPRATAGTGSPVSPAVANLEKRFSSLGQSPNLESEGSGSASAAQITIICLTHIPSWNVNLSLLRRFLWGLM